MPVPLVSTDMFSLKQPFFLVHLLSINQVPSAVSLKLLSGRAGNSSLLKPQELGAAKGSCGQRVSWRVSQLTCLSRNIAVQIYNMAIYSIL